MPAETNERTPNSGKTSLVEHWKKLEQAGIIYYNEDGELCTTPGVIPADTIRREIQQGVYHVD